jgi:hypothetical protein
MNMAKFTAESVLEMLQKQVGEVIGDSADNTDKDNKAMNAGLAKMEKQLATLTDFIAKNVQVEKPKTIEEHLVEFRASLITDITKMFKPDGTGVPPVTPDKKLADMTEKDLTDKIAAIVTTSLSKVVSKSKPTGKKKNDGEEAIDGLIRSLAKADGVDEKEVFKDDTDEEDTDEEDADTDEDKTVVKELKIKLDTVEKIDKNGNEISVDKRQKMQQLDDYLGNVLASTKISK